MVLTRAIRRQYDRTLTRRIWVYPCAALLTLCTSTLWRLSGKIHTWARCCLSYLILKYALPPEKIYHVRMLINEPLLIEIISKSPQIMDYFKLVKKNPSSPTGIAVTLTAGMGYWAQWGNKQLLFATWVRRVRDETDRRKNRPLLDFVRPITSQEGLLVV